MNATKRKFNALIQGIGARSSTPAKSSPDAALSDVSLSTPTTFSSGSMALDAELLAKRRRLGLAGTPAAKTGSGTNNGTNNGANNGPNNGPTTISNVVLRKWSQHRSSKDSQEASKYSPSDRAALLQRLATFQELTDWTPKPERVSEIEWAKRGWVCQGKERVRCMLCHKELVVKLNRKEVDGKEVAVLVPSEIEDALVDRYVELMVTSHQEDCLWRKRGCDDSLLRLSLTNATSSLEALRQRYDDLCGRRSFLPYEFNLRLPEDLNIDAVLSQLPTDFFTKPPPAEQSHADAPNRAALALAILGWQGLSSPRIGAVPNSASCHTCLRRLGLWMFKSREVGADGEVLVPAPMDHLDPVKEHRFFCPWKNPSAQRLGSARPNRDADLPAWRVLVQAIRNDAYLRGDLEEKKPKPRPKTGEGATAPTPGQASPATQGTESLNSPVLVIEGEEEDESARDAKDKERWARLRRVKSLFDTKSGKKLRRPQSRPGTAASTASTGVGP